MVSKIQRQELTRGRSESLAFQYNQNGKFRDEWWYYSTVDEKGLWTVRRRPKATKSHLVVYNDGQECPGEQ